MQFLINAITGYFSRIDYAGILDSLISTLFQVILTIFLFWVIQRVIDRIVTLYFDRLIKKDQNIARIKTMRTLTTNVIQYVYYFILVYSILAILGIPVATLIAGAGVASLAIGFGAQGFVEDMVNGFFILFEHQFDVGDAVTINEYSGEIYQIGIRTTIIHDWNGAIHYIPNRNITNVTNESRKPIRADVDLLIYPGTDLSLLIKTLHNAYEVQEKDERLDKDPTFLGIYKDSFGRLIYRVRFMAKNGEQLGVEGDYYTLFTSALNKANIDQPLGTEA